MGTRLNAMTPARISISSISYGFHNAVNNVHTCGLICVYRAVCDSVCDTQRTGAKYNTRTRECTSQHIALFFHHTVSCCLDGVSPVTIFSNPLYQLV